MLFAPVHVVKMVAPSFLFSLCSFSTDKRVLPSELGSSSSRSATRDELVKRGLPGAAALGDLGKPLPSPALPRRRWEAVARGNTFLALGSLELMVSDLSVRAD